MPHGTGLRTPAPTAPSAEKPTRRITPRRSHPRGLRCDRSLTARMATGMIVATVAATHALQNESKLRYNQSQHIHARRHVQACRHRQLQGAQGRGTGTRAGVGVLRASSAAQGV